ncbi:MAG: hypothetical protein PHS37_10205, partial [Candidatus Omnitrophica bacterium]|nr:hypothetical protein [Candidatus Omnitrophota bacterium]
SLQTMRDKNNTENYPQDKDPEIHKFTVCHDCLRFTFSYTLSATSRKPNRLSPDYTAARAKFKRYPRRQR